MRTDQADVPAARSRLSWWVFALAGVQLLALVATAARYGYHRDEMYFVVAGGHPALGYPDQPPLVPLICWAMNRLAPGSLTVLRLPSALAAAATTLMAGDVARRVGGDATAQRIAAACAACSAFALAIGHYVTTTTFDLLSTTALCWLLVRAVAEHRPRLLALAGLAVGLGAEAKPQVVLVAIVLMGAMLLVGPRWPLRSPWLWAGAALAVAITAPYVVWQATHDWPQITVASNIGGSAEGGRIGFVPFQLLLVSPVLVPVWVTGLVVPWRPGSSLRPFRFLSLTYAVVGVLYLAGDGKAYYLASLYPVLLGLGAPAVAGWLRRGRARLRVGLLVFAVAGSAAVSSLVGLPLLPASDLQGSIVMALNPDQGETVGWPRFVDAVARAWRDVPPAQRRHTVIFTRDYGEAAAVDLRGGPLPEAYSGHNGFSLWGRPADDDTRAILVGYDGPAEASPYFTDCRRETTVDDGVGLDNQEQGLPMLLCRPAERWSVLWPRLRHYD